MDIKALFKRKIVILDGAVGTELQKRGMPAGVCPEAWCLDNPATLKEVYANYIAAGSEIIYTCTFGANRLKLAKYGKSDVFTINKQLAKVARKAAAMPDGRQGKKAFVAGDIGPTGEFVEPFGEVKFEDTVNIFKEQVKGLLAGGVDLFVIETMMDIQEARAALLAVKELTDKPAIVTMTFEASGRTLNGTDPLSALITLQSLGAAAVGCNCSTGPETMLKIIKSLKPYATVPLVAKPNAGMPRLVNGKTTFEMDDKNFAAFGPAFAKAGVNFLGGCCGTTPAHIKAIAQKIKKIKPVLPKRKAIGSLSSARRAVILDKKTFCLVGECINPTGKKALAAELRENKFTMVRALAQEQERAGAKVLDVNAGTPGVDEKVMIVEMVKLLSVAFDSPLALDSAKEEVIEGVLRFYPGRALINSICAETAKMKKLLSLAKKYGAMFILLPLGKKLPKDFAQRKKNIQIVFKAAKKLGFSPEDIAIDGMVMTVSSYPKAGLLALQTIEYAAKQLKCNTIVGLSNISFGLPQRPVVNSTFLALARKAGLNMAIANPMHLEEKINLTAKNLLLGKDKDAAVYLAEFANVAVKVQSVNAIPIQEKVSLAIIQGNREDITALAKQAVDSGLKAQDLVNQVMIPAITKVGELFDKKEYFLPQLIASAETMKKGFSFLEPMLKEQNITPEKKTVVILATVAGDIHDIGKNIVALLLRNHGFEVVDLGADVSTQKIIAEIKKHERPIVGLSALMTTTMVNMKSVVEAVKKENINCSFMVGGAVVTGAYAQSIGAQYARDGVAAVKVVQNIKSAGGCYVQGKN